MEETVIVIMIKEKETGFLEKELDAILWKVMKNLYIIPMQKNWKMGLTVFL